jgi:hypothetical protein
MSDLYDCKPGDTVFVMEGYRKRTSEVTVVKVARKLITVKNSYGQEEVFRLEDGRENSSSWNYSDYLYTKGMLDAKDRSDERDRYLMGLGLYKHNLKRAHGIEWTDEDLDKLYEFLKTLEEAGVEE